MLRVGGHLLPGRAAWVRAHVGVALLDGAEDPVRALRRALGGRGARLVVVTGLDTLGDAERDQAGGTPRLRTAKATADLLRRRRPGASTRRSSNQTTPDAAVNTTSNNAKSKSIYAPSERERGMGDGESSTTRAAALTVP